MPIGKRKLKPGCLFALSDENLLVGIGRLVIGGHHRTASSRASGRFAGNHIASCPRIETVRSANVSVRPLHRSCFSYFPSSRGEIENAAQQVGVNPTFTLALLQHSRLDLGHRACGSLVFQTASAQDQVHK
jgi:hypothetical protein